MLPQLIVPKPLYLVVTLLAGTKDGVLIKAEEREKGPVSFRVYSYFLHAMGYRALALIIATYLMRESLKMCANFWLSSWSSAGQQTKESGLDVSTLFDFITHKIDNGRIFFFFKLTSL